MARLPSSRLKFMTKESAYASHHIKQQYVLLDVRPFKGSSLLDRKHFGRQTFGRRSIEKTCRLFDHLSVKQMTVSWLYRLIIM
jgi:hypothetical protein